MTFKMLIGGKSVSSANSYGVVNPANAQVFAEAPDCSVQQLDEAVQAAHQAQPGWARDVQARRAALHAAADAIEAATEELAELTVREQGKSMADARVEPVYAAAGCRYFADHELGDEVLQDDDKAHVEIRRVPYGVVAGISPWNFPVSDAVGKLAPGLCVGNTMVLKPSQLTPLSTLRMGEILQDVFPPGVLNIVSGGNELGAQLVGHPLVRGINLTGSIETGKIVAAAAGRDLKRVTLELGGNDAAIVLDDIDPEWFADQAFWFAFANNGQICLAIKRIYAPDSIYDDVVEALAAKAREVRIGDGFDPLTVLGPIQNANQFEKIDGLVADALARGGRAAAGGTRRDFPGYFYSPTIIADVTDGARVVDEEQFGPVLPVIRYQDVDDAIRRANNTPFGLGGSVWSSDVSRASKYAEQLECGTAWVNTHIALGPGQPFGGLKSSGIGVQNGRWGLDEFTDIKVIRTENVL